MANPQMNAYLAGIIQQSLPEDNAVRTGQVMSLDGTTLGVLINDAVVPCGYLATWTPRVGETVALLRSGADWLALGPTQGPASPPESARLTGRGIVGTAYFTGGTTSTSAGAENIMTTWTDSDLFVFDPDQLYRWAFRFGIFDSNGVVHLGDLRLRKGFTTAGLQLAQWRRTTTPGLAGIVQASDAWGFIKNVTSGRIETTIGASVQRSAGSGNLSYYGDATYRMELVLEHVGRVSDHPRITATAVAIT